MTSTVRISAAAKSRLRRIQQHWKRVCGERPSNPELLDQALAFIEQHEEQFLQQSAWMPLSRKDLERLRRLQGDYGDWSVADLDEIVYGEA